MVKTRIITAPAIQLASLVAFWVDGFGVGGIALGESLGQWSAQVYMPAATALGAEGVLSLSAQSTTDSVLDLASEIAIIAATLFVGSILILGFWSTVTSPKTALGRLLNNFRIDHLYLDVRLVLDQGSLATSGSRKSFLRSLSLRRASIVTSIDSQGPSATPPLAGQIAELSLPGLPVPIKGRVIKATPVSGLQGSFNLDLAFDNLPNEARTGLVAFIQELRHPARP
jgi:hypothetical protein